MNPAFSYSSYVIKPQGLAIGGKYCAYNPQNQPAFYIEHKSSWKTLSSTYTICADAKRQEPLLLIRAGQHEHFGEYYEVIDAASNTKVGGIGVDWKNFFKDAWGLTDAQGTVVAQVREKSTRRAILHELTDGVVPQVIDILVAGESVAVLRQKPVFIGHHLLVDFSMDFADALDRRLALATAAVVAAHQGATDSV